MVDDWRKALDENKLVGAVMVDLSKAFDMEITQMVDSCVVRGKELKWFQDYLTGRRQRVCVEMKSQSRLTSEEVCHRSLS